MITVNERFKINWTNLKNFIITHFFPNWEDPTWGQNSELLLASTVAQLSFFIANKKLAEKVFLLSKQMAESSAKGVIATWDEGDELCPPLPHPHWWVKEINMPDPSPWKEIASAEQIELAYLLTKFSGLTMSKEFNVALKSIATEIVRGVANSVAEDFEMCGTLPRPKGRMQPSIE